MGLKEIQVINAQPVLAVHDAESGGGGESLADTTPQLHARWWIHRVEHRWIAVLDDIAAETFAAVQLPLALEKILGQAFMRHQIELVRVRHVQPHRPGIGAKRPFHPLEKALAQRLQWHRLAKEGGDFVEQCQFVIALLQTARFGSNALLKGAVNPLQLLAHLVEAARQPAQFIVSFHRQAIRQFSAGHTPQAFVQACHRPDHQLEEKADEDDGADHRHQYQQALHRPQQRRVAGVAAFHRQHQIVDAADKRLQRRIVARQQVLALAGLGLQVGKDQRPHLLGPGRSDRIQATAYLRVARW